MEHKDVGDLQSSRKRKRADAETGPFVLRSLLEDLPLSAEGDRDDIEINCVEFLGTSEDLLPLSFRIPTFSIVTFVH